MPGTCRSCGTGLEYTFVDLGMSPPSNAYLKAEELNRMESFFPLHAWVCEKCKLVQLEEFESPEDIFSDYAYFSSYSDSWLEHARNYTESMVGRFGINQNQQVIEIASNDGYLLQYFHKKDIPVLGIEPAANVAEVAISKGIETRVMFFGTETAQELCSQDRKGDLIIGNNVLAHVPDINDFVAGLKLALAENGLVTMEFPHLMEIIESHQFDTIYHEHFSYLSLLSVEQIFKRHGLKIFDVEQLPTHGGSLRIYAAHADDTTKPESENVASLRDSESRAGLADLKTYLHFADKVNKTKRDLLGFLIKAKEAGKTIAGYGAAAKGNTLLNYCGIRTDFIDYVVDRNPHKQGTWLPGTHIPVYAPEKLAETHPDYILILPWNLRDELNKKLDYTREWGCKLVLPIPTVQVF